MQCSICLEEAKEEATGYVTIKTCGHVFHRKCLFGWIIMHGSCPLCQRDIFDVPDQDVLDREEPMRELIEEQEEADNYIWRAGSLRMER